MCGVRSVWCWQVLPHVMFIWFKHVDRSIGHNSWNSSSKPLHGRPKPSRSGYWSQQRNTGVVLSLSADSLVLSKQGKTAELWAPLWHIRIIYVVAYFQIVFIFWLFHLYEGFLMCICDSGLPAEAESAAGPVIWNIFTKCWCNLLVNSHMFTWCSHMFHICLFCFQNGWGAYH